MLNALAVLAVLVGMALAVLHPSLLVWLCMGLAVVLVARDKIQERRKR